MGKTAIQIVRGAWAQLTWTDDKRLKVGKLTENVAWEIVYQPSHTTFGEFSTPYALGFATYTPAEYGARNATYVGQHIERFKTLTDADGHVREVKSALKYELQTCTIMQARHTQMECHIVTGKISAVTWETFREIYHSPIGKAWKLIDPIFYVEYGEILNILETYFKVCRVCKVEIPSGRVSNICDSCLAKNK